jgi:hypothetical protein
MFGDDHLVARLEIEPEHRDGVRLAGVADQRDLLCGDPEPFS